MEAAVNANLAPTSGDKPHQAENSFAQKNLVSDGFVPAAHIDPNLINPWGVAITRRGPFFVADNGMGVATSYNRVGIPRTIAGHPAIAIATPPGQTTPASPTGEVFNSGRTGFDISSGGKTAPSVLIFVTEDGTISGWNRAVNSGNSILAVDNSMGGAGAVYKGAAIGRTANGPLLYVANFRNGTVDVFDQHFKQVNSFTDPNVPQGYAPFNVAVLDDHLFVTFALQDADKHDDVAGPGHGFVDEFSLGGQLLQRVVSGGVLNSPWGLAIAPPKFGEFSNDLLIGNFGDGTINAFNPANDHFVGTLDNAQGAPIVIGDLWSITPGGGGKGGSTNKIYFTAGVQGEAHGLFGSLSATPEPERSTMAMSSSHLHSFFG
jgi:uncharacterized protein (TIGR03118 family)